VNKRAGLIVVGHGPAGQAAAAAFRELDSETPITVVNDEDMTCYSRPRLPEVLAGKIDPEAIRLHPDEWYQARKLSLCLNKRVVRLDPERRVALTQEGHELPYTRLILAAGAEPVQPPIHGLPLPQVFSLRTCGDAQAIRRQAEGKRVAALVGGGLLGLEAGFALTRLGLRVIVIESAPWLLPRQLDAEGGTLLQRRLRSLGFEFFLGAKAERAEAGQGQMRLTLGNGSVLLVDPVLLSAGIVPRTGLAAAAGLKVEKGVCVDDRMQTSRPDIYAAGDVAQWHGHIAGLWSAAQAMGRVAGINAAGGNAVYPGEVPSTTLKVAGVDLCSQGEVHPENARILVRHDPADEYWVKLFLRDDVLIGSMQIGRVTGAFQYKRLIEKRLPVASFGERLLADAFDFRTIPGFSA